MTAHAIRRYRNHRDTRSVTEIVEWLHVTRIIVSAALVHRNEDRRVGPERRICLSQVHDLLDEAFEQIDLRRSRMAVEIAARFAETHRWQLYPRGVAPH